MAKLPDNSDEGSMPKEVAVVVTRARWLMLIAAVTTAIAIAAVAAVIGYRLFGDRNSLAGSIVNGTIFLPPDAHVVSTTISNGRIYVTLDMAGTNEVRIYDLKTLQQVGDLRFSPQH
jgi:hypothetical protein